MNHAAVLYSRELPGGGYVIIEAMPSSNGDGELPDASPATEPAGAAGATRSEDVPPGAARETVRGWLRVERRADPARRSGHRPPVVVEASGPTSDLVLHELEPIARDNVEVARAIRRWQVNRIRRAGLT